MVGKHQFLRGAVANALLLSCTVNAQNSTDPTFDTDFVYPYGPQKNGTIEFTSSWGSSGGAHSGLDSSDDQFVLESMRLVLGDWDPTASNVSRWLPPPNLALYAGRLESGDGRDFTNVHRRNGTMTRIWVDDDFWYPACARMSSEVARLNATAPQDQSAVMSVVIKHYGTSLPDAQNDNASVATYISANIVERGSDPVETFAHSCMSWFGLLVGQTSVTKISTFDTTPVPLVIDNQTILDQTGQAVMQPAPLLVFTVGGGKAIQADDGTNFTIWIEPSVASD